MFNLEVGGLRCADQSEQLLRTHTIAAATTVDLAAILGADLKANYSGLRSQHQLQLLVVVD